MYKRQDGSITAADAVAKSAAIMIGYLGNFTKLAHSADVVDVNTGEGGIVVDPVGSDNEEPAVDDGPAKISIDELELSVRAYNCLKRAGINTCLLYTSQPLQKVLVKQA